MEVEGGILEPTRVKLVPVSVRARPGTTIAEVEAAGLFHVRQYSNGLFTGRIDLKNLSRAEEALGCPVTPTTPMVLAVKS